MICRTLAVRVGGTTRGQWEPANFSTTPRARTTSLPRGTATGARREAEDAASQPPRPLAIELADGPLDAWALVVGTLAERGSGASPAARPTAAGPALLWRGIIASDGTGPQPGGYGVRLYLDRTAHCVCPDWYVRGLASGKPAYHCKHFRRAWVAHAPRD